MIYVLDPLPVTFSVHVTQPRANAHWFWSREEGELFEHKRYRADGRLLEWQIGGDYSVIDRYEDLQKKQSKMLRRCLTAIECNRPARAACAARHLFRIARAIEAKNRIWMDAR